MLLDEDGPKPFPRRYVGISVFYSLASKLFPGSAAGGGPRGTAPQREVAVVPILR